jgi:hypothetical protein
MIRRKIKEEVEIEKKTKPETNAEKKAKRLEELRKEIEGKSKGGVTKAKDGKSIGNLLKPGEEPDIEKYKKAKDTEASYTMKKSDGSAEHKVMEKIGKEAKNSLKEKILKGQDSAKAEIEMMKEIKEKYGFKKGGVTKAKDGKSIGNLLKPGEEPGEGYEGSPDMYPDYGEDRKDAKEAGKDKAYMQSRGYNEGGSVSRGVGKAIRGTKFKGVF